jgi:hypothetical protein
MFVTFWCWSVEQAGAMETAWHRRECPAKPCPALALARLLHLETSLAVVCRIVASRLSFVNVSLRRRCLSWRNWPNTMWRGLCLV